MKEVFDNRELSNSINSRNHMTINLTQEQIDQINFYHKTKAIECACNLVETLYQEINKPQIVTHKQKMMMQEQEAENGSNWDY